MALSPHRNIVNDIQFHRWLQFELPDYTSPPLDDAIEATPEAYREDSVIDTMRDLDAAGNCIVSAMSNSTISSTSDLNYCQIPFEPTDPSAFDKTSPLGVILYGGALVDPRSYAVLARRLTDQYGLTVVIPVFAGDLQFQFGICNSERLSLAQTSFPDIEKWLFVGHSFGGVAAVTDVWVETEMGTQLDEVAGLVLLASDLQPQLCPGTFIDYSGITDLPFASVMASEDGILNTTRWEESKQYLSPDTAFVVIEGGNHGYFGDYNDTLRTPLLNQSDGEPTITKYTQWDLTVDVIMGVAEQSGLELPAAISEIETDESMEPTMAPSFSAAGSAYGSIAPFAMVTAFLVWVLRK